MNSFNLNRFGKTLRWYVSAKSRQLMMWAVGIFVVTFIWEMFRFADQHDVSFNVLDDMNIMSLAIFIGISTSMTTFNKKTFRSSFLMLPASNLEKYLSLLAYVLFILPICMFAAYALGDTLRMAVCAWLYDDIWLSCVTLTLDFLNPNESNLPLFLLLAFIWSHSLYVLGATFFRRYSCVVSTIVILLLCTSLIAFLTVFVKNSGMDLYSKIWIDGKYVTQEVRDMLFLMLFVLPFLLLTAFNYWASYRIFKGFQLVTNKWTNYDIFKR